MKALIVGANGFIGKNLRHYLTHKGLEVIVASSIDGSGIDAQSGLLSESFQIPQGTDIVFYLAQSPFYRQVPEQAPHLLKVNVVSAVRVAELARRAKVSRFIYTSTGNVYLPSFTPLAETAPLNRTNWYSLSKIQAEEALTLFRQDLNITVVRLFGVYGPNQKDKLFANLWKSIKEGKSIHLYRHPTDPNDASGLKLSWLYIEDLLNIFWMLITQNLVQEPILNLSGPEVLSIRDIASMIALAQGQEIQFEVPDQNRAFDLIADISLLKSIFEPKFTPFKQAVNQIASQQS